MDEADRLLARAFSDIELYRRLLALMPYTVHVDHDQRRATEHATERATRMFAHVPAQRRENALRAVRRPTTPWGHL